MSEKKLIVNCEVCDTRTMKEEDYTDYSRIIINAESILVSERSKSVLNRLGVQCNVESTFELPEDKDIHLDTINGNCELGEGSPVSKDSLLIVNGNARILPGAEAVLERCFRIIVNGALRYPASMGAYISKITVNGKTICYPDDCIILEDIFSIDKYFPLRARQGARYYAAERIMITDKAVDVAKLTEKGVFFVTSELLVLEEKMEDAIRLVDESVKLQVIPADIVYVGDDAVLDRALLNAYGSRLYIDGDLELTPESTDLINQLEKLYISGNVQLLETQQDAFLSLDVEYNSLEIVKGRRVGNRPAVTVDMTLLDISPDGVTIENCASVKVKKDVPVNEILEKLEFKNCAVIKCSPEQKSAIELVSKNVANIRDDSAETKDGQGILGMLGGIAGDYLAGSKVVNAEQHVL